MKKVFLFVGLCVGLVLTSCGSDDKKLLDKIPADAELVVVGNLETIVNSMGGSIEDAKLKLPSTVYDFMSKSNERELRDVLRDIEKTGVDVRVGALAFLNIKYEDMLFVLKILDKTKFDQFIIDEEYEKSKVGKYDVYSNDSQTILVLIGDFLVVGDDIDLICDALDSAEKKSYASTKFGEYIASGNALGVAVNWDGPTMRQVKKGIRNLPSNFLRQMNGVVCYKGDMFNDRIELKGKWMDENGNIKTFELEDFKLPTSRVKGELLSYLSSDNMFAFGLSLKDIDWDAFCNYLSKNGGFSSNDMATVAVVKSYLEKINGTILVAAGMRGGVETIENFDRHPNLEDLSLTAVVETEKAKSIANDIRAIVEQENEFYVSDYNDGFMVEIDDVRGSIYVEPKGSALIISTNKPQKYNTCKIEDYVDFSDYNAVCAGVLSRDNALAQDFNINFNLAFYMGSKNGEAVITLVVEGDDTKGVLGRIIDIAVNVKDFAQSNRSKSYYY